MTRTISRESFHPWRPETLIPLSLQETSEGGRSLNFNVCFCMWLSPCEKMGAVPVWTIENLCWQGKERADKGHSNIQDVLYHICLALSTHRSRIAWAPLRVIAATQSVQSHPSSAVPAHLPWFLGLIYELGRRSCQEQPSSGHLCSTFMSVVTVFLQMWVLRVQAGQGSVKTPHTSTWSQIIFGPSPLKWSWLIRLKNHRNHPGRCWCLGGSLGWMEVEARWSVESFLSEIISKKKSGWAALQVCSHSPAWAVSDCVTKGGLQTAPGHRQMGAGIHPLDHLFW